MVNAKMNTTITVNVRWNALEVSILQSIGIEKDQLIGDCTYTISEMQKLNNRIAQSYNPESNQVNVADRFTKEDHTGKVPVIDLFEKTESILSNMERQKVMIDSFNYDENAEL
jgi:hypothetical protein